MLSVQARNKSEKNGFSEAEHFGAAVNIDRLFSNATLVEERPDKRGDVNIKAIKRFAAPFFTGKEIAEAIITVKESVEHGNRVYSIELFEIKKLSDPYRGDEQGSHIPANDSTYTVTPKVKKAIAFLEKNGKKSVSPETDAAFAEAEANGDTVTAQRLVDEAAGYDASKPHGPGGVINVYHYGTLGNEDFTADRPIHFGTEEAARQRISGKQTEEIINSAEVYQDEYGMWRFEYAGIESDDSYNTEAEARNELAAAANSMANSDYGDESELDRIHSYFINTDNFVTVPDAMTQEKWDKAIAEAREKGYRGIRYRNAVEDRGSWSYIVFNPEDMKLADPFTYDDNGNLIPLSERFNSSNPDIRYQSEQTGHRGALTSLNDDWEATMALFESADGSTVVHETAHFIFDMMEKFVENGLADERMQSDYKKLVAWMTLTPEQAAKGYEAYLKTVPEGTDAMTPEQWKYVEEQERLARGFEAYCMEGRAPSVELQGAFATLRRILLHIYKTVRALGVQLTDDVRQVFDGMLATETTLLRDSILLEAAEQIDKELALMEKRDACSKHAYRGLRKQAPRTRMRPDLI